MRIIWRIIRSFLVLIGLMVVGIIALAVIAVKDHIHPKLPDQMVLAYNFNGTPEDAPATPAWLMQFAALEPSLSEVTSAITRAATDSRVSALAVSIGAGDYHWADVQELQTAIETFRASGKKTYAYAESYGDLYPGMAEYYLASSFDEIWVQPMGSVAITGLSAEVPYVKTALEKLGITAEITQRGDYKTAMESFELDHMSDAQRETLHGILSSMMTDFFDGVARARGLEAGRVGQLIDGAPYTAQEAKERNLVDVVGYQDELITKLLPEGDEDGIVNLVDYYDGTSRDMMKTVSGGAAREPGGDRDINGNPGKSVALIYVSGMIVSGSSGGEGFPSGNAMADDIAWDITDAADDKDVGAIVIRVDSPGGSPQASETIRRAIELAKTRGKYVVVSMGSEAASGGYWVSVDADHIYALPGTLTGSIGVFGAKPDLSSMWDKLNINWESVKMGANAGMWSPNRPYDTEGQAATDRMMDDIYGGFIARVAKGRNFSEDVVEGMAGGRVWTGRQALERGLVDDLGGLDAAFIHVANHLGVTRDELDIYVLPDEPNPFRQMLGLFAGSAKILNNINILTENLTRVTDPSWRLVH